MQAPHRHVPATGSGAPADELRGLRSSAADVRRWLLYWLSALGDRVGGEAEVALHHVLVWGAVAVGYAVVAVVLLWLAHLVLFSWP